MKNWFYKQKNSRRIWITVAAWMFIYIGIIIVGIFGVASGFSAMTPDELENPTLETSLIALVMLLIMGASCFPGIFFTVHAVKAHKADKDAIFPRPLEEIYAEQQQLTENLQFIQSQTDLQTLFAETNPSNVDLKVIRNLSQTLRSTTRRMEKLKKEEEQAKKITEIEKANFNIGPESQPDTCATDPNGKLSSFETMTAPEATTEASPAADEASPAPDPVPPSPSKPSSNIATEPAPAYQPASPTNTITVIDFEIANKAYDSICSVGIVVLSDGAIIERKHFYVQPPKNKYHSSNIEIHGITPKDTETADPFPAVWEKIKGYFQDTYIAAHNASFDMSALKTTLSSYEIEQPHFLYFDTLHLFDSYLSPGDKRTLDALCEKFNIPLEKHHDALCDATATANLILHDYNVGKYKSFAKYFNSLHFSNFGTVTAKKTVSFSKYTKHESARSITASTDISTEKDADFDGKTFLFTGEMEQLSREEAMQEVVKRGGTVKDGISQKIDVLVNANPSGKTTSKVRRAMELQDEGHRIKIIDEETFLKMLADNTAIDI